jgi:hypothetical protein
MVFFIMKIRKKMLKKWEYSAIFQGHKFELINFLNEKKKLG